MVSLRQILDPIVTSHLKSGERPRTKHVITRAAVGHHESLTHEERENAYPIAIVQLLPPKPAERL